MKHIYRLDGVNSLTEIVYKCKKCNSKAFVNLNYPNVLVEILNADDCNDYLKTEEHGDYLKTARENCKPGNFYTSAIINIIDYLEENRNVKQQGNE